METQSVQYFIVGVMTLTDARYFSALGVDYLHFDLNPDSPYAISTEAWQGIVDWVEGADVICSFDHLFDEDRIREIVDDQSVAGVLSTHPDLLDYVHRLRPGLKLFQQLTPGNEPDRHLTLSGVLSREKVKTGYDSYLFCNGPLEAEEAIKTGVTHIALHPGNEEEVGIKDFEAYDRLLYQEF